MTHRSRQTLLATALAFLCSTCAAGAGEATSLSLDGSGGRVEVPRGQALALDRELTLAAEFLFQPAAGAYPLLSNPDPEHSSRGNYCVRVLRQGGGAAIEFGFEPASVTDHVYRTKPAALRPGFNQVAVAFRFGEGNSICVYVNGNLLTGSWVQGDGNAKPRANAGPLLVGAAEMGLRGSWRGNIRRLAIWKAYRGAAKVVADTRLALDGTEDGLAGYWKLETDAKDATMNQNHGKLAGAAKFGPEQKPDVPPPLRPAVEGALRLHLRTRAQPAEGGGEWREVAVEKELPVAQTALLLCDVWDKHWCAGANRRLAAMLPRMNQLVQVLRSKGVQIIHAPSDTMSFYADTTFRRRAMAAPHAQPPAPLKLPDPPQPIDASDGGCDDKPPCRSQKAWSRQHPAVEIAEPDAVTDNGQEVYNLLHQFGIENLLIMGVHTNMCVLHRSFAIKQMTRWGIHCVLIRDLTDTMYNPDRPPRVPHERGTELVVEYIEKHWCPTVLSDDLLKVYPPDGKP